MSAGGEAVEFGSAMPPTPVPMQFGFGRATGPGGDQFVALQVVTPVGQAWYFLTAEQARGVGQTLIDTAATLGGAALVTPPAAGRLIVPSGLAGDRPQPGRSGG